MEIKFFFLLRCFEYWCLDFRKGLSDGWKKDVIGGIEIKCDMLYYRKGIFIEYVCRRLKILLCLFLFLYIY